MTLPVPDFPSPTDLIKAAELATNAGDPALALHFLKTASAAANTLAVVADAPGSPIKPIEEPSVAQPLPPDPFNIYSSIDDIHIEVCKYLRNQDLGFTFRFAKIAGYLTHIPHLVLNEEKASPNNTSVIWKDDLSTCLRRLRRESVIRKVGAGFEYILERHPRLPDA